MKNNVNLLSAIIVYAILLIVGLFVKWLLTFIGVNFIMNYYIWAMLLYWIWSYYKLLEKYKGGW